MHMHSTRGIWKIASVLVAMIIPIEPGRLRKKHRPWAHPLTDKDRNDLQKLEQIIAALRRRREEHHNE